MRHVGNTGNGSNKTFGPKGFFQRAVNGLFALALILGAVAAGAVAALSVASPASATPPGYQTVNEACWATSSAGPAEGATNSTDFATTSNPTSVVPGGSFTWTIADSGDNFVPSSSGGYGVSGLYDATTKWDTPTGATITSPATITQQGYYYNPSTPSTQTAINWTVTTAADANSPSGSAITLAETTNIPGGDDYTTPTISIGLKALSNPTSDSISLNMIDVPPVGSANTSTDPGVTFTTAVTGTPLGSVTAALNCWPSPNPQPPYVTTSIIDNVNPVITIAAPGNASQVVINSHVAANFSCIDPPAYGDGIQSCTATLDGSPILDGALINTSALGPHTLTVTAINNSGYQSQQSSTYTVIEPPYDLVPPTINLTSPVNGQQVITGSNVNAAYTCADTGGSGLASCTGTVGNGALISTTAGYHTFTVKALDNRGNPTSITVGYYARTSNSSTSTSSPDETVGYTTGTAQYDCSMGYTYLKYSLLNAGTSTTCPMFAGAEQPVASWKVTAPAGNGGQLAVGDTLTVDQQVYKPGWTAASDSSLGLEGIGEAFNFGYYSGPYQENLAINAPAGTTINGPITTSTTGLNTTTWGAASATNAAACNYTDAYGPPSESTSSSVSCTTAGTSATASTTVGGTTSVGTLQSTTVAAASNGVNVATFTGSGTLNVAAITNFPTTSGSRLYVATSGGTAILSYTGDSTGKFTGVQTLSGSGTLATGGSVARANGLADINGVVPVASVNGLRTSGSINVATSGGTAVLAYIGTSTTAGTCGTTSGCVTGVTVTSGTGNLTAAGAITQVNPNATTYTGSGILEVASTSGLTAPGTVAVTTTGGSAQLTFTGTSTTAATCGAAGTVACLTGVTDASATSGVANPGGAVTQTILENQTNVAAYGYLAAGANGINVSSLTGTQSLPATALSTSCPAAGAQATTVTDCYAPSGTLVLQTSTGTATVSYTGVSGTSFTGVSLVSGTGTLTGGNQLWQKVQWGIKGASTVNGQSVSGYNWSVNASNQSSFNVAWDGSSCQNSAGSPAGTTSDGGGVCNTDTQEQLGVDGVYIYLQYELVVTAPGTITLGGLPATSSVTNNPCNGTPDEDGTCEASATFATTATAAPGISYTAVDASPPVATLNTPSQGALYSFGQGVNAAYACSDPTSGVTITSCTGVEDAGTAFAQSVANGGALNTSDLVPNQIHTFTVTATNSEGYTSTSYSTFIAIANPPSLTNQSATVQSGLSVTEPFTYSGTYPANLSTEALVTPPSHGSVLFNANGTWTYTNDNSPNASDSFSFAVNDSAGNPSNTEFVTLTVQDQVPPTIGVVTPPPDNSGSYAYQSTVDANYTCADNVLVASCTASQNVNGVPTNVPDGSPLDTSSLIVGNTHSLTITAVDWQGNTTNETVNYTVNTPAPTANNDTASTINPNAVNIPVLNNDTSIFPINPSTVVVSSPATYGSTTVEPNGSITYTPTSASTTSITTDTFQYTVEDTDSQVSNPATVTVTIYPVPGIGGINPTSGPLSAGTSVVITGTGFDTATAVTFDGTPAVSFAVNTNTQITAVAPAAPGNVPTNGDVIVTTSGGPSLASPADVFTWDPVPTVSGVTPPEGVVAGGATITVSGTGFTSGGAGATTVSVGGTPATNVVVNSGTQLTATVPTTNTAGAVDVTVTTPGGTSATTPADLFTYYFTPPQVNSISPNQGSPSGGTLVNITGTNFTGATGVSFGGTAATSFTVTSPTTITAVAPIGTGGSRVDITVTGPSGTSLTSANDQFTYGPQVTSISPGTGPVTGGTSVTINGGGFSGVTSVQFGSNPATSYTVVSNTQITATAPAGTGTVDVTVTTSGGTSPTGPFDTYTYTYPTPSVSGVSPSSGPVGGNQSVTITGHGLTGATAVSFGGSAGTGVVVNSDTSVTVTTPSHLAGTVDVTVTTPGGTSSTNSGDQYTYGPAITSIAPASGNTAGGTTVTITGTDFTSASAVTFGGTAAASYTVNGATSITAVSPAGTGTVNITVTTPDGTSPVVNADQFTYFTPAPAVNSVSPSSGAAAGGTSVTITGSGFTGATAVKFGSTNAASFAVNSATQITAVSPLGTSGSTVDITVTGPGGTSGTSSADHFTYGPVVTRISPLSGSVIGGTSVTITGTGFTGATAVSFGGTAATSFTVGSATSITAVAPAVSSAGVVNITVTAPGGTTPITSADQFTYFYPTPSVSSVSPNVGKPGGGDVITITGNGFTGATTVSFGSTPATSFTVNSNTSITATSPAGTATSVVNITVTGPGGTSATGSGNTFTYGPVVTAVTPTSGSHLGGTTVTVKGAGFTGTTAVSFGTTVVTSGITVNAAGTQITVTAPAHAAGSVDVTVTAGGNTSLTSATDKFTYI